MSECTIDSPSNIHFLHHYFDSTINMIEADIYVDTTDKEH
jgi:hypothetical protein